MRSGHLIKERGHQSGVPVVVCSREPRVRRTGVSVNGDDREALIPRWSYDSVQSYGIEAQLIHAANEITGFRHFNQVTCEEDLTPMEALSQDYPGPDSQLRRCSSGLMKE